MIENPNKLFEISRNFIIFLLQVTNTNTMNRSDKPHLARAEMRRHSFSSWPHEAPMDPEQLIEAGFYYSGEAQFRLIHIFIPLVYHHQWFLKYNVINTCIVVCVMQC